MSGTTPGRRRHPRDGLRDRWVDAVLVAEISRPCLTLMLLLALKMGDHGKVSIRREDLAAMLQVHPQRIAERIGEARKAELLVIVEGTGVRGRVAQYVAIIPPCVPDSGTQSAGIRYGPAVRTFGTHSGVSDGPCVPDSGTHNTRALVDATEQRTHNAGDCNTGHSSKDSSDEVAPRRSPLAAVPPWQQHEPVDTDRSTA